MTHYDKNLSADKIYAFFDVDNTLISVKSMLSFHDFFLHTIGDRETQRQYRKDLAELLKESACWETLNKRYYLHFRGQSESDIMDLGKQWFEKTRSENNEFYHPNIINILKNHQLENHRVVFVSGSFPAVLNPIAKELNVDDILCSNLEVINGYYSGELLPPQTIGQGKAEAVGTLLNKANAHASQCYAYGDDLSDLPMLKAVGNPVVISGGRGLEETGRRLGWKVVSPN